MEAHLHQLEGGLSPDGSDSDGPPSLVSDSTGEGGPPLLGESEPPRSSDTESDGDDNGGLSPQPIEMPNCSALNSFLLDLAGAMVLQAACPGTLQIMFLRVACEMARLEEEVRVRQFRAHYDALLADRFNRGLLSRHRVDSFLDAHGHILVQGYGTTAILLPPDMDVWRPAPRWQRLLWDTNTRRPAPEHVPEPDID